MNDEWTNPDNAEDWLYFFHKEGRRRTPAKISRNALETCFHSAAGESLVNIYVANTQTIEEQVRVRLRAGGRFTAEMPLALTARDFESRRLAMYADLVASPMVDPTAQELLGRFTAEELEAVALWMRSRSSAQG
ncbi:MULTISPECIES: hypothetical protein [unclassified Variovorax]|uniref:hypothetical protein n=1 Tax=unclassified Variovorax TaxID=663243 RepID=UPI003F463B91